MTDLLPGYRETVKKLWFVPAACVLGSFAAAIVVRRLLRIAGGGYWYGSGLHFWSLLMKLLPAAGFDLAGLWLACPEGLPAKARPAADYGTGAAAGAGCSAAGAGYGTGTAYSAGGSPDASAGSPVPAAVEELRALKDLPDQGILTQEEFDAKKRQILGL